MTEELTGFMCMTDFECELYWASGGTPIYPSIEDIRQCRKCVDSCCTGCGIVEVRVELVRVVQEANDKWDEE